MINIMSYVGMDLQSEVCLWTLLGLLRTIFDATLFKVNDNLKQVWQMRMPQELTRPVQRVLRTMISGVILVQCFTVYVYLASYIVLLYPVFLEERPTLVLPWLLLAAIRKLLCELMSLALGLGTCVLLGPARPPCIKFVIVKLASITPAFYMWLLVFSYYHVLKMTAAFKTFPAVLPANERDYGLELAVRRRRTKSLLGEEQLRSKLMANLYGERTPSMNILNAISNQSDTFNPEASIEDIRVSLDMLQPQSVTSARTISDIGPYEDCFGSDLTLPRDTDRILEQFGVMLLRIATYLKNKETTPVSIYHSSLQTGGKPEMLNGTSIGSDDTDTPPDIGISKGRTASYLTDYPQIFMKTSSDLCQRLSSEHVIERVKSNFSESDKNESKKSLKNKESQNYISHEIIKQTKTVEIKIWNDEKSEHVLSRDDKLDGTKERSEKNLKNNNVECKAINTTCNLKPYNKSMNSEKNAASKRCTCDRVQNRINVKTNLQNDKKEKIHTKTSQMSGSSSVKFE